MMKRMSREKKIVFVFYSLLIIDSKMYIMNAITLEDEGIITPYGITNIHVLDIPDTDMSNRKAYY